jgi:hypothetical protein
MTPAFTSPLWSNYKEGLLRFDWKNRRHEDGIELRRYKNSFMVHSPAEAGDCLLSRPVL